MAVASCRVRFLSILFLVAPGFSLADITPVWTPADGLKQIVVEAEDVDHVLDGSDWTRDDSHAHYWGHGYVRSERHLPGSPSSPLTYHLNIRDPGTYALMLRVWSAGDDTEAAPPFLRARSEDGQAVNFTRPHPSPEAPEWVHLRSEGDFFFSEGTHEIRIESPTPGNEPYLDRFILHPADSGPPDVETRASPLLYSLEYDDLRPPTAPTNLRLKAHGCAHLHLLWDEAADDESAVLGYDIFWRRRWIGRSYRPEYVMSDLDPYSLYHVNVRAIDLGGNASRETSVIVETSAFDNSHGATVKKATSAYEIDGIEEPHWLQQRAHALTHPENDQSSQGSTMRLAWTENHLYLAVTTPPITAPQLLVHLDPALSQSGWLSDQHFELLFAPSAPPIDSATYAMQPTGEGSASFHELALPWSQLRTEPQSDALLGLNVTVLQSEGEPVAAWRWSEDIQPARKPYQFGVMQLAESIPSGSKDDWLPSNIWRERDHCVIIEAEAIEHDTAWDLADGPQGFCGDGSLVWKRPPHYESAPAPGASEDYTTEQQGQQNQWLIVRIYTDKPGGYHVDLRFRGHTEPQQAWLGRIGQPVTNAHPIRAIGLDARPEDAEETYAWSSHGSRKVQLKRGINNLYLSPATETCAIDRIVLYRENVESAKAKALDPSTFPSQAFR